MAALDMVTNALEIVVGVNGRPIPALFRRFHGEEVVARWRLVPDWNEVPEEPLPNVMRLPPPLPKKTDKTGEL